MQLYSGRLVAESGLNTSYKTLLASSYQKPSYRLVNVKESPGIPAKLTEPFKNILVPWVMVLLWSNRIFIVVPTSPLVKSVTVTVSLVRHLFIPSTLGVAPVGRF